MCQKKPGLRCSKHANSANKKAAARVYKLSRKKNKTLADVHILEGAKKSHDFTNDLYFASPIVFKMLNKENSRYKYSWYLNTTMRQAGKNAKDFDNHTEIKIGHMVRLTAKRVKKSKKSTIMVVNTQHNSMKLWDSKDPYSIVTVDIHGDIVSVEKLDTENKVYGFETQKKPDSRWAIWYTSKEV